MRSPPQPIHYRSPESLIRNSFCNDKIDIERVELALLARARSISYSRRGVLIAGL